MTTNSALRVDVVYEWPLMMIESFLKSGVSQMVDKFRVKESLSTLWKNKTNASILYIDHDY